MLTHSHFNKSVFSHSIAYPQFHNGGNSFICRKCCNGIVSMTVSLMLSILTVTYTVRRPHIHRTAYVRTSYAVRAYAVRWMPPFPPDGKAETMVRGFRHDVFRVSETCLSNGKVSGKSNQISATCVWGY